MMLPRSRKTFDYTWSRPLEYFNSHNRYPRYRRTAALDGGRFCWQFVGKNAHELYFVLLRAPSKNDREWLRSKEARINRCTTHPVDKSTARSVNRWWEIGGGGKKGQGHFFSNQTNSIARGKNRNFNLVSPITNILFERNNRPRDFSQRYFRQKMETRKL